MEAARAGEGGSGTSWLKRAGRSAGIPGAAEPLLRPGRASKGAAYGGIQAGARSDAAVDGGAQATYKAHMFPPGIPFQIGIPRSVASLARIAFAAVCLLAFADSMMAQMTWHRLAGLDVDGDGADDIEFDISDQTTASPGGAFSYRQHFLRPLGETRILTSVTNLEGGAFPHWMEKGGTWDGSSKDGQRWIDRTTQPNQLQMTTGWIPLSGPFPPPGTGTLHGAEPDDTDNHVIALMVGAGAQARPGWVTIRPRAAYSPGGAVDVDITGFGASPVGGRTVVTGEGSIFKPLAISRVGGAPVIVRHPLVMISGRYRAEVATDLERGPWTAVYSFQSFNLAPAQQFVRCRFF